MKKRIAALLLGTALALALASPALAAAGFTDVPASSALRTEIDEAVAAGLMQGYSTTKFGYADPVTRAQFVTVLGRMLNWQSAASQTAIPAAMAVPKTLSSEYLLRIKQAAEHDVVDAAAPFRPSDPITRAEMSEMLVRALGLKSAAALTQKTWTNRTTAFLAALPFADVSGDSAPYIAVAYTIGMTKGTTALTFSPSATATRAQAAAMLVRMNKKLHGATDFVHGFYAISSASQIGLTAKMDAVSAGWSRMTWDGTAALLATTSAGGNEYFVPSGYADAVGTIASGGAALQLGVYMDTSGGLADLLASPSGRAQAAEQIVQELTVSYKTLGRNPYAGVTLDFEGLRSGQREDYNAFLTTLSTQIKALHKSLYVCVSPLLVTGSSYSGYDYAAIGKLADKVIVMAYDYDAQDLSAYVGTEYYKTAAPAPADQVYLSLLAAIRADTGVEDASKVVLGLSCKNVAWKIDGSGKLLSGTPVHPSNDTVAKRLAQSDTVLGWSDTYESSYAVYTTEDGSRYFLWYDSARSAAARLTLAKLMGITGVSVWRLGIMPAYPNWSWEALLNKTS